jgi:hypothetical protein
LENVTFIRSVQLPAFIQQRIRHVYRLCAAARLGPARPRLRSLLARAHGDGAAYAQFRDRYRNMARTLGFEGHMQWAEAVP